MEELLRTHDLLWLVMLPRDFLKLQAGLAETLEELNILKNLIDGLRANVLQQAEVLSSTNTHRKLVQQEEA